MYQSHGSHIVLVKCVVNMDMTVAVGENVEICVCVIYIVSRATVTVDHAVIVDEMHSEVTVTVVGVQETMGLNDPRIGRSGTWVDMEGLASGATETET